MSAPDTFRKPPSNGAADGAPGEPVQQRKRKRPYVITAILVAAAVGGTAAALVLTHRDTASTAESTKPVATGSITQGDVVDTQSVDGTLTYSNERAVPATATGVVTWAPKAGTTITRGKPLYKADNKPVTLMYGSLPIYRALQKGSEGADVKELELNLKALGYGDGLKIDDTYTAATARAVKKWQKAVGLTRTGVADATQVVFESGPVRVSEVDLTEGGRVGVGAKALMVTGTKAIVHVDLDTSKQDLIKKGDSVTVELPSGDKTQGRITSIGTVAKAGKDNSTTVGVDITLVKQPAGNIDQAPVTVDIVSERARNVLSVPIEALLGLSEGGFGIQVVNSDGTARIVPIRTGTYGGGRVEVVGTGLRAGMKVEVPSS